MPKGRVSKEGRAKHKMRLSDSRDPRLEEILFLKSVRSRVLQKLLILDFAIFVCPRNLSPQKDEIMKRLLAKGRDSINMNVCEEMTLEEVMEIIKVSKRTAIEYKIVLSRLRGNC